MYIQLSPGSQECLCSAPDVHNPLGSSRDLTVISDFTLAGQTGRKDTVLALVNTALIKALRESNPSGDILKLHSQRAPAYGVPVAGPVVKVPEVPTDVLRHE